MSNSLFSRYHHSYIPAKYYPLSSPVLYSNIRPSNSYRITYPPNPHIVYPHVVNSYAVSPHTGNNYSVTPYVVNPYTVNTSMDNNRINLLLIAILILTSLDLIFIRPYKRNN